MKKKSVITGTDVAYYASIIMMVCSIIGVIFGFVYKSDDIKLYVVFLLLGAGGHFINSKSRASRKNQQNDKENETDMNSQGR